MTDFTPCIGHPTVVSGAERARLINVGIIRFDPPRNPLAFNVPFTVDQLARRGFDAAADCKRAYEAAMTEWRYNGGMGRMPRRD